MTYKFLSTHKDCLHCRCVSEFWITLKMSEVYWLNVKYYCKSCTVCFKFLFKFSFKSLENVKNALGNSFINCLISFNDEIGPIFNSS